MASDLLEGNANKTLLSMSFPISIGMLSTFFISSYRHIFCGSTWRVRTNRFGVFFHYLLFNCWFIYRTFCWRFDYYWKTNRRGRSRKSKTNCIRRHNSVPRNFHIPCDFGCNICQLTYLVFSVLIVRFCPL